MRKDRWTVDGTDFVLAVGLVLVGAGLWSLAGSMVKMERKIKRLEDQDKDFQKLWGQQNLVWGELREIKGLMGDTGKSLQVIWGLVNQHRAEIERIDKDVEKLFEDGKDVV
jgi:hypothetical protein